MHVNLRSSHILTYKSSKITQEKIQWRPTTNRMRNVKQKAKVAYSSAPSNTHTHTHPFNGPFSGTTRVSQYQKGKTNLDFTEARDSEWQWHQLGHMQVCTSLQTDNHASTPPLRFLQAGCPSCRPTNSVKALKGLKHCHIIHWLILIVIFPITLCFRQRAVKRYRVSDCALYLFIIV